MIAKFENFNENKQNGYSESDLTAAIRFAIEKYTNYHKAMSATEAEATLSEWKERGEFYENKD